MTPSPIVELRGRTDTIRNIFVGGVMHAPPLARHSQAGVIQFLPTDITVVYDWDDRMWIPSNTIVRGPRLRGEQTEAGHRRRSSHRDVEMYFPYERLNEAPEWVVAATLDWKPGGLQL